MAKSPFSKLSKKNITSKRKVDVMDIPQLKFTLNKIKYDLSELYHFCCDKSQPKQQGRIASINEFAKNIKNGIRDKKSEGTIANTVIIFRQYVTFCDKTGVNPISRAGYLAYCGNNGELRRQVKVANSPHPYLFMYDDGDEIGIKEVTANSKKSLIVRGLTLCGVYNKQWESTISPFIPIRESVKPYRPNELNEALKRLQLLFFSLAIPLIQYAEENPDSTPPLEMNAEVNMLDDGEIIELLIKPYLYKEGVDCKLDTPFNLCMSAAYYLFAYYTSFNDTVILDVRHPIEFVTSRIEGRTVKHTTVRGWKGRSNKVVEAVFSDAITSNEYQEASDDVDSAGCVYANLDKKDGKSFIQVLAKLSEAYKKESHGKLIYHLYSDNSCGEYKRDDQNNIPVTLNLLADNRIHLVDHFIESFYLGVNETSYYKINTSYDGVGKTVVRKDKIKTGKAGIKKQITQFSFAAVSCLTDLNVKNALLPLSFSEKDESGNVTVSFKYLNGKDASFSVAAKYVPFLKDVQEYAERYNPYEISEGKGNRAPKRPAYLIPMGARFQTYQWEEYQPVKYSRLKFLGLGAADYFINLNAQRFRATTSNELYDSKDGGWSVSQILQHSLEVAQQRYVNGHPDENTVITSQALQVVEEIAKGNDVLQAKENVRKRLNIEVLEHDKYLARRKPTNINGLLCDGDGKADLITGKDEHRSAETFAKKQGLTELELHCYQYDLCPACKSAKLVNDVKSVYKLLSFIECLEEAVDLHPGSAERLAQKAEQFTSILHENIPLETIKEAEDILLNEGRYKLLQNSSIAVSQYL
ncbi:hypothetical protein WOB74_23365 [Vibrio parahaemolyticus]